MKTKKKLFKFHSMFISFTKWQMPKTMILDPHDVPDYYDIIKDPMGKSFSIWFFLNFSYLLLISKIMNN